MGSEICIQQDQKKESVLKKDQKPVSHKGRKYCALDKCNRRLTLTDMACRCEKIFCTKHRIPEAHACQFNYKAVVKEILKEQNPQVTPEKVSKI